MKRTILRVSLVILVCIVTVLLYNVIFTTSEATEENSETSIVEKTDSKYLENIGVQVNGKEYFVGDADGNMKPGDKGNSGNITIEDASIVLTVVANYLAGSYTTNDLDDAYVTYVGLVQDGRITENANIRNSEDLYKVFDVDEDGEITVKDAQQILKYYACKAAGL